MNSKLLIDSIVRQTTILIAQLSTAAGIRAPLSHVADQVFLDLSREIEAQGVRRKVAADMFGLALRTYQKKVQRLTESVTDRDRTLWEAVLDFLRTGSKTRASIMAHFENDGSEHVAAVLKDLAASGFIYGTGRGDTAVFGLTSPEDHKVIVESENLESVAHMVWLQVFQAGTTTEEEVVRTLVIKPEVIRQVLAVLIDDGRVIRQPSGELVAGNFLIPLGATKGWEAAVFDHFRTVTSAITAKLRSSASKTQTPDTVGGATLHFIVHAKHPHNDEVLGLLARMRQEMNVLWYKVSDYNREHPHPEDEATKVSFYFGQNVDS